MGNLHGQLKKTFKCLATKQPIKNGNILGGVSLRLFCALQYHVIQQAISKTLHLEYIIYQAALQKPI